MFLETVLRGNQSKHIRLCEHLYHGNISYTENPSHHYRLPLRHLHAATFSRKMWLLTQRMSLNSLKGINFYIATEQGNSSNKKCFRWLLISETESNNLKWTDLKWMIPVCLGSPHLHYKWLHRNTEFTLLSPDCISASLQKMTNFFSPPKHQNFFEVKCPLSFHQ